MAAVSQVIPNYVQGISNQPDQLKVPGQVRDLKNAWPDVTRGCMKRLGSKHIKHLGIAPGGTWFSIDRGRNPADQYIGNLQYIEGGEPKLSIWNLNGVEQEILYSDTPYDDSFNKSQLTQWIGNASSARNYLTPKLNPSWSPNQERAGTKKWKDIKVYQGDGKTFFLNDQIVPDFTLTEESKTIMTSVDQLTDDQKFNPNNYFESFLSLRQVQYQREYLLAFDDPMKNDTNGNIQYPYAMEITDTRFRGKDPNDKKFDGEEAAEVCDLEFGYTRTTIDAKDACFRWDEDDDGAVIRKQRWKGNKKLVVHSTTSTSGENLEITLEVVCRAIQQIDRHVKNPAKDEYYWISEYKERVQLLNGGRNWVKGDKIILGYRPDNENPDGAWKDYLDNGRVKIEITIGKVGKQTIMADIGYVSVRTDNANEGDTTTVPFASANDIIQGLCYGLETAGAIPLVYKPDGSEGAATERIYTEKPATVDVQMGAADTPGVSNDITGKPNETPFLAGLGIEFKPIGNGIYFRKRPKPNDGPAPFKLVTPEEQLFNHMSTKEVNEWYCTVHAVSRLPSQCRNNLKVKVMNTESTDADDYYVKFVGHDGVDGEGSWEECVKPGYGVKPKFSSMPHELVLVPSTKNFWVVTPIDWNARSVGDEKSAEAPAFLQKTIHPTSERGYEFDSSFQKKITGMAWYRNRMILFTDKNISMSADGDYYNFWPKTARTINDQDPIEITAVARMPSPIVESMEMSAGLVLFGRDEQFLLTTDADGMRPGTTKVMAISRYNYNTDVSPIKMGQNIAFLSDAGLNDKLFEMSQVSREGSEPQVIEISKLVEPRLPDNIDMLTASKSNMAVFMGKYWGPDYLFSDQNTKIPNCDGSIDEDKYRLFNNEKFREIWGYRYYENGQKRVQSAWFRWTFDLPVCYHVCIDDNYYVVMYDENHTYLRKIGLKHEDEVNAVYLDGYYSQCPSDTCFSYGKGKTIYYPDDWHFIRDNECVYAELYNKNDLIESFRCGDSFKPKHGAFAEVRQYPNVGDNACRLYLILPGDWTWGCNEDDKIDCNDPLNPWRVTIGKPYDMVVDIPTPYVGKKEGDSFKSKWDPNLTLHRLKFSVGPSAMSDEIGYRVEVKRKSREKQNAYYPVHFDYPEQTEETFTHPVYMRNTDVDIKFICSDPHGGILYSMQWEGDLNPKWYKYV